MKYIKNITVKGSIIALLLILSIACDDNFLDRNPLSQISSPAFWNTQNDADMALTGCYARLRGETFTWRSMSFDVIAGDATRGYGAYDIALGLHEANSGGLINTVFTECYRGIATCNFFLENIERVPIPEQIINQYKGEVMFLRALFYFTLTDFYGGVPLYTKTVTIEEAQVAQSTKQQVIEQVIKDLDFAIANLPNTDYSSTGHAVKGTALALKSRVLLYQSDWAGAAAAAKQVMTEGKFSLSDDFKNMFLKYGQDDNPEIMFSTRYLNPDNSSEQDIQIEWWGGWNPLQELVDAFECTDGLPITQSPLYDPTNFRLNRDPRLKITVNHVDDPAVKASGEVVPYAYNDPSRSGYQVAKAADVEELPVDYSTKSEQDWILIRYAEVLLNYAEAQNEVLSIPDLSVYNAINAIRARPGIDMPPLPAGLSKEQMRARIWNERRVELAMEGHRYGDVKRWKLAETYINTIKEPDSGTPRVFNPSKHYLFPFPQSEMDVNPNLVQNPGY